MMYQLEKYNNGRTHELDSYDTAEGAIAAANALHDPSWPFWQGIKVYQLAESTGRLVCIHDTNS